jgi:hypothetical protein
LIVDMAIQSGKVPVPRLSPSAARGPLAKKAEAAVLVGSFAVDAPSTKLTDKLLILRGKYFPI